MGNINLGSMDPTQQFLNTETGQNDKEVIEYPNGDTYEGQVANQMRHGLGTFISKDKHNQFNYEYEGHWVSNKRENKGRCFYYNGDLYQGNWKQGKRHGEGTYFSWKGDRYVGMWANDLREGQGTLWSANNTKYEGFFLKDKKHGSGEIVFPDGSRFREEWENGALKVHEKTHDAEFQENAQDSQAEVHESSMIFQRASRNLDRSQFSSQSNDQYKLYLLQNKTQRQLSISEKMTLRQNYGQTPLEMIDSYSKVTSILLKHQDVNDWTTEQVSLWLQAINMDQYKQNFIDNDIDGYSLLNITDEEMEKYLQISDSNQRALIQKAIKKLCLIWQKHGRFSEDYAQEQIDFQQYEADVTMNCSLFQPNQNQSMMFNTSGTLKRKNDMISSANINQSMLEEIQEDPINILLYQSLKSGGFKSLIDFSELKFDQKKDKIDTMNNFGEIYKGKWLGIEVQIKKFSRKYQNNKTINMFVEEISVLHSLRHPNIVLYMGVSFDPRRHHYYMVSEYIGRGNLYDCLHQKNVNLSDDKIFKIAKQIATSMCYLQRQNVLHCDLKSKNVLICDDNKIKLTDFGLARQSNFMTKPSNNQGYSSGKDRNFPSKKTLVNPADDQFTQISGVINQQQQPEGNYIELNLDGNQGSRKKSDYGKFTAAASEQARWTAPEILRGEKYDSAADVYSFGVVLWEMVTKEVPYEGRSAAQITGIVGYFGEQLKVPKKCNQHLKKIINNCLLFQPKRRPGFEDIIKYLEKVESQPREANSNPYIGNLKDFLS